MYNIGTFLSGKFFFCEDYRKHLLPSEADEACQKMGGKNLAELANVNSSRSILSKMKGESSIYLCYLNVM